MTTAPTRTTTAVLVGVEDIRGLHAARTLARHGITVTAVVRDRGAFPCRSRHLTDVIVAETRTDEFVDALAEIGPTFAERPLLIPCTDMVVRHLSEHRDKIDRWYAHTLPDRLVVDALTDKIALHRHSTEHGLPVPRGCEILTDDDVERAVAELTFPLALKPRNSKSPDWLAVTNVKAFRVTDPAELRQLVATYREASGGLLAQEWIEGPDTELYACHGYFGSRTEPLATFVSRKLRQWPPAVGQACLAEEIDRPQVRDITLELFRSIDFTGLGYVEVKRDVRTDEYLIVEPNIGRVSGRMAIAEQGGVDLLHTAYCHGLELPLPPPEQRQQTFGGAKWVYLRQDLMSAAVHLRQKDLTLTAWRNSLRGPKRFAVWSRTDPKPMFGELADGVRTLWRRRRRGVPSERTPDRSEGRSTNRAGARHFYDSVFDRRHRDTGFAYSEDPDSHYIVPILRSFLEATGSVEQKCLEVGTGYGQCQWLASDYTGVDIAFTSSKHVERPFVNADATDLPFPDAQFDCVWSNHVMEHVDRPDLMMEEIWRVLKPGGHLFITATWQVGPWLAEGHPVRPFSDFGPRGKLVKLTWRIRDSVAFRAVHVFPRRAVTRVQRLIRASPVDLRYTALEPSYEYNWQPDATAESSVEPYAVYSWLVSRGAECLNYSSDLQAFFIRTGHMTFRKPSHSAD